jgi:hypothetical protein
MHVKETASFQDFSHSDCSKTSCQFICIADLDLHLTLYLNELDRVFFCKENQHYKESWWLPAFYSFCIQGMVRNALMGILIPDLTGRNSKISQHLYLGVRLFIAASGAYDPLIEYSSPDPGLLSVDSCEKIRKDRYKLAQVAVGRAQWMSRGIESSADYLKKLFEDDGEVLLK